MASQAGGLPVTEVAQPDGDSLSGANGATLDLCNGKYPSESLRLARHQVDYVDATVANREDESNELVQYKPAGGAQAYREVRAAAAHCAAMTVHGVRQSAAGVHPRNRLLAADQLTVTFSLTQGGQTVWGAAVYQYFGDLFTGIYDFRGSEQDALAAATALAVASKQKVAQGTSV